MPATRREEPWAELNVLTVFLSAASFLRFRPGGKESREVRSQLGCVVPPLFQSRTASPLLNECGPGFWASIGAAQRFAAGSRLFRSFVVDVATSCVQLRTTMARASLKVSLCYRRQATDYHCDEQQREQRRSKVDLHSWSWVIGFRRSCFRLSKLHAAALLPTQARKYSGPQGPSVPRFVAAHHCNGPAASERLELPMRVQNVRLEEVYSRSEESLLSQGGQASSHIVVRRSGHQMAALPVF